MATADGAAEDDDDPGPVEQVPAREMMVSNVFPLDLDDQPRTWTPPAAPSITDLWAARRPAGHPATPQPEPLALLRAAEPDPKTLSTLTSRAGDTAAVVLAKPEPARLDSRRSPPAPVGPPGEPTAVVLDVLTLPAGVSLRRACTEFPGVQAWLARYPELATRDAAQSIRFADPGSRSGLLPHRTDSGCYLAVLITRADCAARVDTVTSGAAKSPPGSTADATAHRMLAAHIDGMAKRKSAEVPVIPLIGQLPLFPLPGQLPEPAPPATQADRPVTEAHGSGTAA